MCLLCSLPDSVRTALSYVACARCSAPGPHRAFVTEVQAGAVVDFLAVCSRACAEELRQDALERNADVVHGQTVLAIPVSAN